MFKIYFGRLAERKRLRRSFKIRENELDFVKKNARTRNDWEIVNKFIRSWCYSLRFAARVVGAAQTRTCRCKLVACGQLTQVRIYGFGAMSRGLHRTYICQRDELEEKKLF